MLNGWLREPLGEKQKLKEKKEKVEAKCFVSDPCKQMNGFFLSMKEMIYE